MKLVCAGLVCAGLLTLAGGAQKELLRFGCACLMVVVLLSLLGQARLPALDTGWYEEQMRQQVAQAQAQARQTQLEQVQAALAKELERQAQMQGIACTVRVVCSADAAGSVTVDRVEMDYHSGPREHLPGLREHVCAQLGIATGQMIIQEEENP